MVTHKHTKPFLISPKNVCAHKSRPWVQSAYQRNEKLIDTKHWHKIYSFHLFHFFFIIFKYHRKKEEMLISLFKSPTHNFICSFGGTRSKQKWHGKMMLPLLGEQNPPLAIRVFFSPQFCGFPQSLGGNLAIIFKFML
jgi:hypothetical protein